MPPGHPGPKTKTKPWPSSSAQPVYVRHGSNAQTKLFPGAVFFGSPSHELAKPRHMTCSKEPCVQPAANPMPKKALPSTAFFGSPSYELARPWPSSSAQPM